MQKTLFFIACIFVCSVGAFFVGAYFSIDTSAVSPLSPNMILSDVEKNFSDNPDNVFIILGETRALLAGTSRNTVELQRAELKLRRATDSFFRKNLDMIALSMYRK